MPIALSTPLRRHTARCLRPLLRFLVLLLATGLPGHRARAQAPPSWLLTAQSRTTSVSGVNAMRCAVDAGGNVFVVGSFNDVLNFGTLPALTSRGNSDIFVAKLSPAGQWLWAQSAGGSGADYATSIGLSSTGEVLVAGNFVGTARFGSLPGVVSAGGQDVFVARLAAANGQWLATQHAGGVGLDNCSSLVVTANDEVVVAGSFSQVVAFGPTHQLTTNGGEDVFVARLTSNLASWHWATQAGSTGTDGANDLALTANGDAVVVGAYTNTTRGATFDNLPPLTGTTGRNMFVARLQGTTGEWTWAIGSAGQTGSAIAISVPTDEVVVAGNFAGTVTLAGSALVSAGSNDVFVARLDGTGQWLTAQRAGGPGDDTANDVVISGTDGAVVVGYFNATATFGTQPSLTSVGARDLFVAQLNRPLNRWGWALRAGGTSHDSGNGVAVAPSGRLTVTGYFGQQVSFGGLPALSSTSLDAFVAQLGGATTAASPRQPGILSAQVYPNPASRNVSVQLPGRGAGSAVLLNSLGQLVRQATWPEAVTSPSLDVRGLPAGAYQLRLTQGAAQQSQRLMVE
ncbi:T9SS type A sorting domain-containing protein [Hymenobacter sp. CRA2]|uniref:T9SS type A sorting domain-containing protein n=1 Tax=Hymenobacter sp. CRA2 TaxID=1955620 RepID=UPI0009D26C5F|nr:T9SS type A sorting domain-containing protein [Hymenobacter sp. CRA2]OON68485.1 hypothetical protein B0919_12625 [Hymenobacter sp. CRA2]